MEEILDLLRIQLGPGILDDSIRIRCFSEFEPHGRASETWEEVWVIELPYCQYFWKSTIGFKKGKEGLHASFKGKTFEEVEKRAIEFLKFYKETNQPYLDTPTS